MPPPLKAETPNLEVRLHLRALNLFYDLFSNIQWNIFYFTFKNSNSHWAVTQWAREKKGLVKYSLHYIFCSAKRERKVAMRKRDSSFSAAVVIQDAFCILIVFPFLFSWLGRSHLFQNKMVKGAITMQYVNLTFKLSISKIMIQNRIQTLIAPVWTSLYSSI